MKERKSQEVCAILIEREVQGFRVTKVLYEAKLLYTQKNARGALIVANDKHTTSIAHVFIRTVAHVAPLSAKLWPAQSYGPHDSLRQASMEARRHLRFTRSFNDLHLCPIRFS